MTWSAQWERAGLLNLSLWLLFRVRSLGGTLGGHHGAEGTVFRRLTCQASRIHLDSLLKIKKKLGMK